ncbi:hypothetical protein ACFXJO_04515 [Streptomyces lavendulae]|uniref:hypothetical protein n=1 Tax=Streptomyces lavendulae TaxID=1914 RepID=UPI0036C4EEB8
MAPNRQGPVVPAFRLEFLAFCDANRDAYLRYAQVRIEDHGEARRCVDAVLEAVERRWVGLLGSESPTARVWRYLRDEAGIRRPAPGPDEGRLRTVLRDDQADIVLLHHQLRIPIGHAARLMGITDNAAHALLRGAERDLGSLDEH